MPRSITFALRVAAATYASGGTASARAIANSRSPDRGEKILATLVWEIA